MSIRYHGCVGTVQITVRLPDSLVASVDDLVSGGSARSRADLISRALERELRRAAAERDFEILSQQATDTDMDALAAWASDHTPALDD